MAILTSRGAELFPKFPYYMVALTTISGHTLWISGHDQSQLTSVYGARHKYSQLKSARTDAQGLVDKHATCDIFICMVDTIGRVTVAEYVHKYRVTKITEGSGVANGT